MNEDYLTVEEVARRFRTSPSSVYKWIHHGTGPKSVRVGKRRLFPIDELNDWEQSLKEEGAA